MYDSVHKRRVSGIAFIRYMYQYSIKIGKSSNLKDLSATKSKGVSRITKLGKGYPSKREIDIREIKFQIYKNN